MTAQEAYCLHCFEMLPACVEVCPHCGNNLIEQHQQSYAVRLTNALAHPLADVRMRVIIALGLRGEAQAAEELAACSLRHPVDVVEGLEIVRSLARISETIRQRSALARIAQEHPAHAVRQAALGVLEDLDGVN